MSHLACLLPDVLLTTRESLRPVTAALLAIAAGVLLIEIECLLPGRVVFGAGGLLLTLIGVHWLSLLPVNGTALLLAGLGTAFLLLSVLSPLRWSARIAGTGLLSAGTALLEYAPFRPVLSLSGLTLGLLLGCCTSFLLHFADRAHRSKHRRAEPQDPTLGWRTHVPE